MLKCEMFAWQTLAVPANPFCRLKGTNSVKSRRHRTKEKLTFPTPDVFHVDTVNRSLNSQTDQTVLLQSSVILKPSYFTVIFAASLSDTVYLSQLFSGL